MNIAIAKPKLGKDSKAFLAKKKHMLIDGKWVEARSGKTFEVEDPATQEIIAHVPAGDKADIDLAVKAARKAFETGPWSRISPAERSRLVWNLGDLLEKHADEFAEIEALDNGKPVTNARRDDVGGSIAMFRYMAGWATRLTGETIPVSSPGNWHAYTAASAGRRRRADHPLELPAHDGGLEACPGARRGLHDCAQARRADAAVGFALW
jgi:phenylacetaldehyde dehydrogenase